MDTHTEREDFLARAKQLRTLLLEGCSNMKDVRIHEGKEQAPHIVNLSLLGRDTDYLVALLDAAGFAVSTKSACESDKEGSRAILSYTGESGQAASTLRVSWGREVSTRDMKRFVRALIASVEFLDSAGILKT
jgi:cysteine desulfurase